ERLLDLDGFRIWHEREGLQVDKDADHRRWVDEAARGCDILIIDPWYKLIDEELSEGMKNVGTILRFLNAIQKRNPRTAIVIGFHADERAERLSGLGAASGYKVFHRDCDT